MGATLSQSTIELPIHTQARQVATTKVGKAQTSSQRLLTVCVGEFTLLLSDFVLGMRPCLCGPGTMFVFGRCGTFGTCLAADCSEDFAKIIQNLTPHHAKSAQITKSQHVEIWGCQF